MAEKIDLSSRRVGEVELPTLDLVPYIGKKVKIAEVVEQKGMQQGEDSYFIVVKTEPLTTLKRKNGEEVPVCATRIYGLVEIEGGKIGWGSKGKLADYLKRCKLTDYMQLVGREVIVQVQHDAKKNQDFLTFKE